MRHVAVCALALVGCSPDLACALLADPSNCFAQQAVALADCMPMRAMPAALSTDGTTCTFADGVLRDRRELLMRTGATATGGAGGGGGGDVGDRVARYAPVVFNAPVSALGSHVTDPTGIRFTVLAPDGSTCGTLG